MSLFPIFQRDLNLEVILSPVHYTAVGTKHSQVSLKAKTLLDSTTALYRRFIISEKGFLGPGGFLLPVSHSFAPRTPYKNRGN